MNIPEKALDAVFRHALTTAPPGLPYNEAVQAEIRKQVRNMLDIATPIIAAEALRDSANRLESWAATDIHMHPRVADGYKLSAIKLRGRAEEMDTE